jgi:hypothetical protein
MTLQVSIQSGRLFISFLLYFNLFYKINYTLSLSNAILTFYFLEMI